MGYNGNGAGEFVQITEPNFAGMERAHEKESSWTLVESGPVYSRYRSDFRMDHFSVQQIITVFHQKKQIDLEYLIPDWPGEYNRQLRVLFPLNMEENTQISYDVPMGMVHVGKEELKRAPMGWAWGGTYRQMPEKTSGNGLGFTMSTDIVTADWMDPSREAVDYPVINSVLLSSHKSCHGLGNWYHQKGSHSFRFSITSHEEGWKNGFHFGVENNHPLRSIIRSEKQKGILPSELSFISTSDPFAVVTALKKAEDDSELVVRLMEAEGENKQIQLELFREVGAISMTDMIEENPVKLEQQGEVMHIELGKNAVDTYKMQLK
jgi:alpha-mannosidase